MRKAQNSMAAEKPAANEARLERLSRTRSRMICAIQMLLLRTSGQARRSTSRVLPGEEMGSSIDRSMMAPDGGRSLIGAARRAKVRGGRDCSGLSGGLLLEPSDESRMFGTCDSLLQHLEDASYIETQKRVGV